MSKRTLLAIAMSAGALAACGGGGDGSEPAATKTTIETYAPGAAAYLWLRGGGLSRGELDTVVQRKSDNAVIGLNQYGLDKEKGVLRDFTIDKDFAIGRWVEGKLTTPAGTETIAESNATLPHFVYYRRTGSLPTSGSAKCEKSFFTVPSYLGGANPSPSAAGAGEGTASIKFTPAGADVTLSLTASNGSHGMTPLNASGTLTRPTGTYLANDATSGDSALVAIGLTEKGYQLVGTYTLKLSSQARYSGLFRFSCDYSTD